MKTHEISITVKNHLKELDRIAQAIDSLPVSVCCSTRKRSEINLIVEELFTNIVSHGIDDQEEHEINILFSWTTRDLTIRIEDDGKPFNPITVDVPDTSCCLADRTIGGLGIHLVKHFMDVCNYVREKGKNIMVLKKLLSDPSAPDTQQTNHNQTSQSTLDKPEE